jgi:hypothetical protein
MAHTLQDFLLGKQAKGYQNKSFTEIASKATQNSDYCCNLTAAFCSIVSLSKQN